MPSLIRTGTTALYQPDGAGPGNRLAFLAAGAEPSIALDDCWAETGSANAPGYFVLLDQAAGPASAGAIVTLLRDDPSGPKLPPAPAANGVIWLTCRGASPRILATSLSVLDPEDAPTVAADTIIVNLPGMPAVGFGKGARILPIRDPADGGLTGLTVLSPPVDKSGLQPASGPQAGPGVQIDLTSAGAGQLTFAGLIGGQDGGDVRELMNVLVDPQDPLNSSQTFAGHRFALVQDVTGIHLRRVV